ncbi:MAG: efflux RND transporter periplasmic adaptor subunit [Planctomycetes bacterium]|nr:efflux RND transporter periplasmic adaptor subunit [Planctomycetota bacterium]
MQRLQILAVSALVALAGCEKPADSGGKRPEARPVPVQVEPLTKRTLSAIYPTSATLRAAQRATVTSRSQGELERILVDEGAYVEEGQILAELDDEEERLRLAQAEAKAKSEAAELERAEQLSSQGALSTTELETRRNTAAEAETARELAALTLRRTRIRAPFSGTVLKRHLDPGGAVSVGMALFELAAVSPLRAEVSVPERYVPSLAVGDPATVAVPATRVRVAAEIERISPETDVESGTVKVTLLLPAASGELRPGSFVTCGLTTDRRVDALTTVRAALVSVGRQWFVYRVVDGKAQQVEVTLGFEQDDYVELEKSHPALAPGDLLVVTGAAALADGTAVEVLEPAKAEAQ